MRAQAAARTLNGPKFRRESRTRPSAFGATRRRNTLLARLLLQSSAKCPHQSFEGQTGRREASPLVLRAAERAAGGGRVGRCSPAPGTAHSEIELSHSLPYDRERIISGIFLRYRRVMPEGTRPRTPVLGQPDHPVGILAERPQAARSFLSGRRLPETVDALCLERVE